MTWVVLWTMNRETWMGENIITVSAIHSRLQSCCLPFHAFKLIFRWFISLYSIPICQKKPQFRNNLELFIVILRLMSNVGFAKHTWCTGSVDLFSQYLRGWSSQGKQFKWYNKHWFWHKIMCCPRLHFISDTWDLKLDSLHRLEHIIQYFETFFRNQGMCTFV